MEQQSNNRVKYWEDRLQKKRLEVYLQENKWTTYLAYELSKSQNKSNIDTLYKYEALLTQCSYLSRLAYVPADIFCRMTEHLDITPNAFNDYIKAIEDIYDDLFKYKCSYDSKYIQEHPKFKEKFNPYNFENSEQQKEYNEKSKKPNNLEQTGSVNSNNPQQAGSVNSNNPQQAGSVNSNNPQQAKKENLNNSQQQNETEKFNNKIKKNSTPIGYFIQNKKKLNAYIYLHHNTDSRFNNTPTLYISFKGSSNFDDFWHDLKSAVSKNIPLWELNKQNNKNNNGKASSVFIKILTESITDIYNRVIKLIKGNKEKNLNNSLKQKQVSQQEPNNTKFSNRLNKLNNLRIVITGHSLGGALAELFGYYLTKYKSIEITCPIHVITFGACCVFNAAGRNEFNSQLSISGPRIFTLDRITANGDPVVLLPAHLDHGGYTLLKTEYKAFTKTGRTNEIGEIRKMLGLEQGKSKENYDGNELLVSKDFIKLFKNSNHFIKKNGAYDFNLYKKKYRNLTPNILKNNINKRKIKKEAIPNFKEQRGGVPPEGVQSGIEQSEGVLPEENQSVEVLPEGNQSVVEPPNKEQIPVDVPESESYEFRKNTKIYKQETLYRMPNQINYSCYKTISKGFCHGVYMGVSYMNVLRLIGDKEPVKDYILYKTKTGKLFSLPEDNDFFSHTNPECSLSTNDYIEPNINPSGFNTIKSTSRCSIM